MCHGKSEAIKVREGKGSGRGEGKGLSEEEGGIERREKGKETPSNRGGRDIYGNRARASGNRLGAR
jgi:hypothetical protein